MYGRDLKFISFNHIAACRAWLPNFAADFGALNFASKGHIWWAMGYEPLQRFDAPVVWWTLPYVRYRYGSRHALPWEHRYITFQGDGIGDYTETGLLPQADKQIMLLTEPERFRTAFDDLLQELAAPTYSTARAIWALEGLLLQLHEQDHGQERSPYHQPLTQLANAIDDHCERDVDFHHAAQEMGLSYSHFRREFRRQFGQPPQQYLLRTRLRKASALLRRSQAPVKQIAAAVGFEDIYHFTKRFRAVYGEPPGRYRRRTQLQAMT